MFSVPKLNEARGNTGAASVAALCALSMCAGGAYAVTAARHARSGARHAVPVPRIGDRPNARTDLRWALFTFTDKERRVGFQCSLDGSKYRSCSARTVYGLIEATVGSGSRCHKNCNHAAKRSGRANGHNRHSRSRSVLRGVGKLLSLGRHTFRVKARRKTGRESRPATFTWMIMTKAQLEALERAQAGGGSGEQGGGASSAGGSGSGIGGSGASGGSGGGSGGSGGGGGSGPTARTRSFVISGQPEGSLYPGGPLSQIPLAVFNPNPIPIYVTSLAVAVASSPAGCPAAENLHISQSDASPEKPLAVPPDAAVTLPAQGVSAPAIQLLNLPVNQNACQNVTFPLTYTGSAHS
jgi:hypothetical protein